MTKLCKKCSKETYSTSNLCYSHLKEKEREKMKVYAKKARLKVKKEKKKEKKKLLCSRCGENKRYKRKKKILTVCRSCFFETSVEYWSDKAWSAFAKWLKKDKEYFTCYTCHKTLPIEQAQAGHCFHRGNQRYRAIDFDPKHIKLQCGGCNCFSTGQTNIFQARLTRELGIEEVEKMIWRRANEPALTIEELKDLITEYSFRNQYHNEPLTKE